MTSRPGEHKDRSIERQNLIVVAAIADSLQAATKPANGEAHVGRRRCGGSAGPRLPLGS